MSRFRTLAIGLLATLALAGPAKALEPVGLQWRVSHTGPDGDPSYLTGDPAVAYNSQLDQYLMVWHAEHAPSETEIFGRLYSSDGAPLAGEFRISQMGLDDDGVSEATAPDVTYDAKQSRYLVVWAGDDGEPLSNDEFEIYGQRLDAAGNEIGSDFRVSDMGVDGSAAADARTPAVAHNAATGDYLVIWSGDDGTAPLGDDEYEIFGQRLTGSGLPIGANDFRISEMGTDGDPSSDAAEPAVAANGQNGQFLAVWGGDDALPLEADAVEYYGQLLGPAGSLPVVNDFRISDVGPNSNDMVNRADVVFHPARAEYLVAFHGNVNMAPDADRDIEVLGQRLSDAGAAVGSDDFRISHAEPDTRVAISPALAVDPVGGGYLVGWQSDTDPLAAGEHEVFARQLTADGVGIGADDMRVSVTGAEGTAGSLASSPAVAWSSARGEAIVAWRAWSDSALADNESEVFARRMGAPSHGDPSRETGPQGGGGTRPDTTAPSLTVGAPQRQRLRRDRTIAVRVRCDEACTLSTSVAVRIAGRRRVIRRTSPSGPLAAAVSSRIRVQLSRRGATTIRRALRNGRRVTAKFAVTASDTAGNRSRLSTPTRLVRR